MKRSDKAIRGVLFAALAATAMACGGDGGDGDDGGADTAGDAEVVAGDTLPPGRTFFLGAVAEAYDLSHPRQWVPSLAPLGTDLSEAVIIPLDLLGIPWEAFTGPDNRLVNPPGPWLDAVAELEALAMASGKPIALRLSPLRGTADGLAPEATEGAGGTLLLNRTWRPDCYDPSGDGNPTKWRDAYAGFVTWAVERFDPRWVIVARRLNLYEENCGPSAYSALVDYVAEAQRRVVALGSTRPITIAGVDVEDLYGFPKQPGRCVIDTPAECFEQRKTLLSGLDADALGLESYPASALVDGLDAIPGDWLTRVADARSDLGAAIIGTHLPAAIMDSRRTGVCTRFLESSEAQQAAWLDQVLNAGATREMSLVAWSSVVDLLDLTVVSSCPCAAGGDDGVAICQHLDQLNARADEVRLMVSAGLVGVDGSERQGLSLWTQILGGQ